MADVELQQIGSYSIIRLLSESSTSRLYVGRHQQRKKDAVVKVFSMPLTTREAREAFLARAKLLKTKLRHRYIAEVQDFGMLGDQGYLAMQYLPGGTILQRFAPGGCYAPDEVKRVLSPIADALHYAHVNNILHGNLHPGNLLMGERNDVLLTDFSLLLEPFEDKMPALLYRAPEHWRGTITAASDQYSLAVMVYEWLCGRRPYKGTDREKLSNQQEHEAFPLPHILNEAISPAVERVLLQALAYKPDERFPHTQAFADAYLRALMGLPIHSGTQRVASSSMPVISNNGGVQETKKARSEQAIESPVPQMASIEGSKAVSNTSHVSAPIEDRTTTNGKTPDQNDRERTFPPTRDIKTIDDIPFYEKDTEPSFSTPSSIDESRLQNIVSADLRQGGVLSKRLPGYEEREAQIEMAALVARSLTEETPAIIEAATGTGKALDVDTPIPTPSGWKRMGDLVAGDFVFDEKGHPTRILSAFDVLYDRKCYEVLFSDGSSLIADAAHEWASYTSVDRSWASRVRTSLYTAKNFVTSEQLAILDQLIALSQNDETLSKGEAVALIGGHQWSIYQEASKTMRINPGSRPARYPRRTLLTAVQSRLTRDLSEQRRDGRPYSLVTTEKMAATLTVGSSKRANHAIAVAGPLVLLDAELPIAPYFLGAWLGDGNCRNNQITTADPDLITEIEKDGYTVRSLKSNKYLYAVDDENGKAANRWQSGMTGRLRKLGLLLNKHIPSIYLRASEQQRRALLAGLLDTDGTVSRCGAVEFTTTNAQLAQDMYELICSLGFRPSLRRGRARLNGKDCGPKWMLAFTTNEQVFRLERKITAHKERLRNYTPERNLFRYVVAVREVPSRPVRCIAVESESHLYLAGRAMIPTHNSLAYLVPIVRSNRVAIISTANKALQEQLFYKDIPFVQKHIKPFPAALIKGMANYLCLDRMESERHGIQYYVKNRDFLRLINITEDPESSFDGDFETLGFQLPAEIRSKVHADTDQCAWSKCNFFSECYVRKMRVKASNAQVMVVNHTLLLIDAAMEGFLLPDRELIIVDEAHHLEEEATRVFTVTVSQARVSTLLAQRMLKEHSSVSLQDEAVKAMTETWRQLEMVADPGFKGRANLHEPLEEGLRLATVIADLADSLRKQRPKDMPEKESNLYDKLIARTENLALDIRMVFSVGQPGKFVYYVERVNTPGRRGGLLEVSAAPLDVTSWLKKQLFEKSNVICTSATLATIGPNPNKPDDKGPNFAYFRSRTGLDFADYPDLIERILPLTFDYEHNALLYLPRHLPEPAFGPNSTDYMKAIAREMERLVEASRGRAFLLFSSKRMLEEVYEEFCQIMPMHLDYPLLRQGDLPRTELTRKFREEEGAVLFGLKSFWEGVDIAGEALSLVVIDKLPFDPPDDPVHEARVAQMKANGENWFGTYVLPQAVLRLKQGLGRLLRTRDDRGVMGILDTRLYTKGYGKLVINALPPARRTASLKDVEQFFAAEERAAF